MSNLPSQTQTEASLKKLLAIQDRLAGDFVAKGHIIKMMLVCAIAQEPMVIFGEPGTAKSAIISRFCDYLGFNKTNYFKYLLTAFTEPDELLGVIDIDAYMKEHTYQRIGKGGIQKAKIVFLDEVFRGNSAILNTLLSIINERIYYESGETRRAATQVVYGATNDPPSGHDLRAFYARFPIRLRSERVSDSHPQALLEKGWKLEVDELNRRQKEDALPDDQKEIIVAAALCEPIDLENCQAWLHHYWSQPEIWADPNSGLEQIKHAYFEIIQQLNDYREQFQIDDRKAVKLFKIILAHTMLENGLTAAPGMNDIYQVLRHTWQDPELASLSMDTVEQYVKRVDERYAIQPDTPLPPRLRFRYAQEQE